LLRRGPHGPRRSCFEPPGTAVYSPGILAPATDDPLISGRPDGRQVTGADGGASLRVVVTGDKKSAGWMKGVQAIVVRYGL
jgi:hypothetical protein